MSDIRFITVRPGHFHAALIQKEMLPGIDRTAHVYAPLDADLVAHLTRIAGFNARAELPTSWQLEVHTGPDYVERFLRDRPGNVVVLAGRNRTKIDLLHAAAEAGLHVLADKPWIVEANRFGDLEATLAASQKSGAFVFDIMTERFEITSILQRELVNDPEIFGTVDAGLPSEPAVYMESIHYLKKQVAGAPLRRPGWFFDVNEQGEALTDVGTHLVDQVLWMLFTDKPIDHRRDVQIISAKRWPTRLTREQFRDVTGLDDFPMEVREHVRGDVLDYYCNTSVDFAVRGVHVKFDVLWDYEAAKGGGDTHNAVFRGTKSSIEIRQTGGSKPELFVVANNDADVSNAVTKRVQSWLTTFPGVESAKIKDGIHIAIPDALRTSHETHFAEVLAQFLRYLDNPASLPTWEFPHLLAKYWITTQGVALARQAK